MKLIKSLLFAAVTASASFAATADVAVVVNASNSVNVSAEDVSKLFLGKVKAVNGVELSPVNQVGSTENATYFNKNVLKKSNSQLKAYWSKLVFTGKGKLPKKCLMTNQ